MTDKMLTFPKRLETNRLILRKYENGDGKELYRLLENNNNREYLKEYIDETNIVKTETDAEIRTQEFSSNWIHHKRFVMSVGLKSSGRHIRQIWINPNKWEVPSFELGWFLGKSFQGQGLATEVFNSLSNGFLNQLQFASSINSSKGCSTGTIKLIRSGFLHFSKKSY